MDQIHAPAKRAENRVKVDFEFRSGGELLHGNLFLPEGEPQAALVLTGPLTSVKEQASGAHARALSERGFAALAFDHRFFGEKQLSARRFENPRAKNEDISAPRWRRCATPCARAIYRWPPLVSVPARVTWRRRLRARLGTRIPGVRRHHLLL